LSELIPAALLARNAASYKRPLLSDSNAVAVSVHRAVSK